MNSPDTAEAPKTLHRALQGLVLALGAPLGWLLIRVFTGHGLLAELTNHTLLYLYLLIGTSLAFTSYGYFLGRKERKLIAKNRRLEARTMTDRLTGLRNSRYFWQRIREVCAEAQRENTSIALLLIDLDHFKRINDQWGHRMGDDVLATVGSRIAEQVREADTAARVGGEEFAILLPRTESNEARRVGERIREAFANTEFTTSDGTSFRLTLSVGVATQTGEDIDGEKLFRTADNALYRAKEEGRNRVCFSDKPPADQTLQEVSAPAG